MRLPTPLSALGSFPLCPDTSFGILHLVLEPRLHPTPSTERWFGQIVISSMLCGVLNIPARDSTVLTPLHFEGQKTYNIVGDY